MEDRVLVQYQIKDGLIAHIASRRDGELIKRGIGARAPLAALPQLRMPIEW
jgi:hypothetical protein